MADKTKPPEGGAPQPAAPPPKPGEEANKEKEPPKPSVQPKDEVGTRKGCRRYRWELKDSNKEFWVYGHAIVKIISLGCLIAALILFHGLSVHPTIILIISMELSIFVFFIVLYSFAIQRYMPFILWPITDLLNDLFACGFLIGGIVYSMKGRPNVPLHYLIAVILMGVAAFFAFIDICLQRKHFKGKKVKKNVLVPPPPKGKEGQEPPKEGEKPKEPEAKPDKDKGKDKDKDKGKDKDKDKGKDKDKDKGKGKK